jgi:Sigma-70, region 4
MSRLDDLPPDQRATLSLLLRSGKSYAEVASLLDIQERAVHDRAHAALAVLAPREARELTAERRDEVGDYLLGQRSGVAERLAARAHLEGSREARAWANALAGELAPLASGSLPEIPNGARPTPPPAPAPPQVRDAPARADAYSEPQPPLATPAPGAAPTRSRPSPPRSRRGGALLLAAIVAIVIVAVVLIANGGGSSSKQDSSAASAPAATGTTGTSTNGETANSSGGKAKEDKRITLAPPDPSSPSRGVAEVLSEGKQYAFYLAAEHLPPSKGKGFFYAVWLYNSPSSHEALSRSPDVGANGNLQGGALLPSDAGKYHTMLLTRETASRPTYPGPVVLSGPFALH